MEKPPENLTSRVINILKEKGLADPIAKSLLGAWILEQEKYAEKAKDYNLAQIEVNLKSARLYFSAGYIDEAFDSFECARTQAWNENRDELYKAIMKEMDTLEDSLGDSQ